MANPLADVPGVSTDIGAEFEEVALTDEPNHPAFVDHRKMANAIKCHRTGFDPPASHLLTCNVLKQLTDHPIHLVKG
jgi:hypothetical protein